MRGNTFSDLNVKGSSVFRVKSQLSVCYVPITKFVPEMLYRTRYFSFTCFSFLLWLSYTVLVYMMYSLDVDPHPELIIPKHISTPSITRHSTGNSFIKWALQGPMEPVYMTELYLGSRLVATLRKSYPHLQMFPSWTSHRNMAQRFGYR